MQSLPDGQCHAVRLVDLSGDPPLRAGCWQWKSNNVLPLTLPAMVEAIMSLLVETFVGTTRLPEAKSVVRFCARAASNRSITTLVDIVFLLQLHLA